MARRQDLHFYLSLWRCVSGWTGLLWLTPPLTGRPRAKNRSLRETIFRNPWSCVISREEIWPFSDVLGSQRLWTVVFMGLILKKCHRLLFGQKLTKSKKNKKQKHVTMDIYTSYIFLVKMENCKFAVGGVKSRTITCVMGNVVCSFRSEVWHFSFNLVFTVWTYIYCT